MCEIFHTIFTLLAFKTKTPYRYIANSNTLPFHQAFVSTVLSFLYRHSLHSKCNTSMYNWMCAVQHNNVHEKEGTHYYTDFSIWYKNQFLSENHISKWTEPNTHTRNNTEGECSVNYAKTLTLPSKVFQTHEECVGRDCAERGATRKTNFKSGCHKLQVGKIVCWTFFLEIPSLYPFSSSIIFSRI